MDIQEWLDKTALPRQPSSLPDQFEPSAPLTAKETEKKRRERRRRRYSTSDSSLLDMCPTHKKAPPVEYELGAEGNVCSSASHSEGHSEGISGSSSISNQMYARQPRRKTRLGRYNPSTRDGRERGKHAHWRRKGESKKRKRKSKPKKGVKPGGGIIQSFHAKNVPSDRLTVRCLLILSHPRID